MKRVIQWITALILLAFVVVFANVRLQAQSPLRRLNVLLIAVDDLNNNLGCYGHPVVKSPNIDRLAQRGVRFDRAYCQYPLCNPSRTSFLSGRRPDTTGIAQNTTPPRMTLKDVAFLPEYFKQHGYFTAGIGKIAHGRFADAVKWDVREDPARGGGRDEDEKPNKVQRPRRQRRGGLPVAQGARQGQLWHPTNNKDEEEPDGIVARRVAALMEQNKDKPFFIAAGFHKPHLQWIAPKKYFDMYPPDKIQLPQEPADDRQDIPSVALNRNANFRGITDEKSQRQAIAAYYACTTFMDAQVGVLLDALDRLKLWDKTVVVFFSDHGFHLGEHGGLWAKMSLFEQSARAPLLIATPGKKAGVASPRLVELVDVFPTLTQLCGLPTPEGMEGVSLERLLEDPHRPWKSVAFTQVQRGGIVGRSVRTERYRYTEWGSEKVAELYDHETDPLEHTNLANDPKHAKVVEEMRRLLKEGWRAAAPPLGEGRKK
jgi:uncharacterized sulfatase